MPAIDVVDETFLAVPRERVARRFADSATWSRLWPDLGLELMTDRGAQGIRWTVVGERVGTMEVWCEEVLDGTVLHYFLRIDPAGRDRRRSRPEIRRDARSDRDEGRRRQRDAKRIAFALKRELERGRPAGEPPEQREHREHREHEPAERESARVTSGPMRLHVVSDVHGNDRALAGAADGADGLVVLGDLLEFVDYRNPDLGIMGRLLGPEVTTAFTRLRGTGARSEMVALLEDAWARFDDPQAVVREEVAAHYDRTFTVLEKLDVPVWAIPGNVDMPGMWPTDTSVSIVDGTVEVLDGLRFGFVGGVPLPPGMPVRDSGPWRPHFVVDEEFGAAVSALGPVDVLCSHAPPAVPDLAYDVVARRREGASPALRDRIADDRPSHALFGHVHQPLAQRRRVGSTECVNVGHFRLTEQPYVLRW